MSKLSDAHTSPPPQKKKKVNTLAVWTQDSKACNTGILTFLSKTRDEHKRCPIKVLNIGHTANKALIWEFQLVNSANDSLVFSHSVIKKEKTKSAFRRLIPQKALVSVPLSRVLSAFSFSSKIYQL